MDTTSISKNGRKDFFFAKVQSIIRMYQRGPNWAKKCHPKTVKQAGGRHCAEGEVVPGCSKLRADRCEDQEAAAGSVGKLQPPDPGGHTAGFLPLPICAEKTILCSRDHLQQCWVCYFSVKRKNLVPPPSLTVDWPWSLSGTKDCECGGVGFWDEVRKVSWLPFCPFGKFSLQKFPLMMVSQNSEATWKCPISILRWAQPGKFPCLRLQMKRGKEDLHIPLPQDIWTEQCGSYLSTLNCRVAFFTSVKIRDMGSCLIFSYCLQNLSSQLICLNV